MKLSEVSDLHFATADAVELESNMLAIVEGILGRKLERADPLRLFLKSLLTILIQQRVLIDEVGRMNLLAFSKGTYLERLGDLVGVERLASSAAVTTMELTLSVSRAVSTTIRKGTRFTAGDEIYFALEDDVIFIAGETVKTAKAICTTAGEAGNGYAAGEITRVVDPQAFLQSVRNVTLSEGGTDVESDDALRERIHEAPEAYSCAGSEGAYIFHAKSVSQLIVDVAVDSSEPGKVEVYPLLKDGELPHEEILSAVSEHLNAKTVRPLTDDVSVLSPVKVEYALTARYWISREDAISAAEINDAASEAVTAYIEWQRARLGRDINPTEFIHRLKVAGVKRVEVTSPKFKVLTPIQVAVASTVQVTFAGLEDE